MNIAIRQDLHAATPPSEECMSGDHRSYIHAVTQYGASAIP